MMRATNESVYFDEEDKNRTFLDYADREGMSEKVAFEFRPGGQEGFNHIQKY